MKHLKPYNKINEGYFPYKYEITNDEVEKIYQYFYKWVYPQDKIKLMNECILESIEWTDFLTFYGKEYNPQRFKLVPYLGVVYSGLGTFSGTLQEMQRSILNNEHEYKNYQNKHIIKDSFNTIYQDHFDKTKHGFPFYEYKLDLICQDDIQIDDKLFKKAEIVKLLSTDYFIQDKFILTGYIRRIIESWAKHMDMNVKVFVKHYGKSWRGNFLEVAFSFEVAIIDLDFVPPPFE